MAMSVVATSINRPIFPPVRGRPPDGIVVLVVAGTDVVVDGSVVVVGSLVEVVGISVTS
jgi:hypothetical protein